jgi:hypothetical protein
MRPTGRILAALAIVLTASCPALACNICGAGAQNTPTLREDAAKAKLVLYGTLANARLNANDPLGTAGTTDLRIDSVLKADPVIGDRKSIVLPRYVPLDPRKPATYLVFCDVSDGKLDPYRGLAVRSAAVVDYLRGLLAVQGADRVQVLQYCFGYLDHRDPDVAADAFHEFAKASDREVGQVAGKLRAEKLRRLLQDPLTPPERIGLYAFLLGACGGSPDAEFLRRAIEQPKRAGGTLGGLLSGYIELRPREGWELARKLLGDESRPFLERLSVVGTLRFFHGWKPEDSRLEVLRGLAMLLPQGDIADLAIEDLRRWQYWDLTPEVLAQFGKPGHDAPIMRRGIVRYALSCPRPEAGRFIQTLRREDPQLVKDVEEFLQFEKQK